jgi:hypothetical protein
MRPLAIGGGLGTNIYVCYSVIPLLGDVVECASFPTLRIACIHRFHLECVALEIMVLAHFRDQWLCIGAELHRRCIVHMHQGGKGFLKLRPCFVLGYLWDYSIQTQIPNFSESMFGSSVLG